MKTLAVDASIVIKWMISEDGSAEALALRSKYRFAAPDLLVAECVNILWKKTRRGDLTDQQAELAAGLVERSSVDLVPMRRLMRAATEMAIRIRHPAYDCMYLSLAAANGWTFVTADETLARKIRQQPDAALASLIQTMSEAAAAA